MLERILHRLALVVLNHHRIIAGIFLLLTAVSGVLVSRLEIKTDLIDVMPHGNQAVTQFKDFMQKYNILETVTVVITSETKNIEDHAPLIESLAAELKKSPLVVQVDHSVFGQQNDFLLKNFPLFLDEKGLHLFFERLSTEGAARQIQNNFRMLSSPMTSPFDAELIEHDPLNLREIVAESQKRSRTDNRLDLSMGYYATSDHSTALIFVKPAGRSRDMDFVQRLRPELEAAVRAALAENGNPGGVTVRLTGGHIFSDEMRQVIRHDVISSSIISVILIGLIIRVAYRVRLVVLAIVGCTTLSALLMTLAAAYLIFGSLNIVTSVVAVLLIGMYVDYCILTLKRYGDEMLLHNERSIALVKTMTKAGAAMVISALTTAVSFFSIIVTRFDGLHELGVVSGIGVLLCLLCTFFLMNALLVSVSAGGPGSIIAVSAPSFEMDRLASAIERRPKRFVFGSLAVILLLLAGIADIRFDNNPANIGMKDSPAISAMKAVSEKLDRIGEPLEVIIKEPDVHELTGAHDRLERLLVKWKSDGLVAQTDSLGALLPPPTAQRATIALMEQLAASTLSSPESIESAVRRQMDRYGILYDNAELQSYLAGIVRAAQMNEPVGLDRLQGFADSRVARFFNREDMSIVAYLYPHKDGWRHETVAALRTEVAREGATWSLIGSPILYEEIKSAIFRGSGFAAGITMLLNLFLIIFFVKRTAYIFFAILPVSLGFLLTPAVMGVLNAPLNFINVGTMALIFGFGVDYGLYIMQSYLREDARSVRNALRLSGKNVLVCASTTIAGCGSLVTASFAGIASLGLVLTIGALCCSLVTLVLLPSLLCLYERRNLDAGV